MPTNGKKADLVARIQENFTDSDLGKPGQYSAAKVHDSLDIHLKVGILLPASLDDYVHFKNKHLCIIDVTPRMGSVD